MNDLGNLLQWERFITPSIIKVFYVLAIGMAALAGLSGVFSGLVQMAVNPFLGALTILASLIGALMGVLLARIVSEAVLVMFRINEHLGAIRQRGQM
jgi:hypothetical protein